MPRDPHAPPRVLSWSQARRVARRVAFRERMLSFIVTCVLAALSLAFGGFLLLWQFLAPSREPGGNGWLADVVLLSVGALGALFVGTVFTLTVFVRAERWLATLPRTQVAFQRTPDLYRA